MIIRPVRYDEDTGVIVDALGNSLIDVCSWRATNDEDAAEIVAAINDYQVEEAKDTYLLQLCEQIEGMSLCDTVQHIHAIAGDGHCQYRIDSVSISDLQALRRLKMKVSA